MIQVSSHVLGMHRILHTLQTTAGEDISAAQAEDIRVWVGLTVNEVLETAFTLPLFRTAYSWSRDTLAAVIAYCDWLLDQARFLCIMLEIHTPQFLRC